MGAIKGDQTSLLKNRLKCGPTHFLSKLQYDFYRGKSIPKIMVTFYVFSKKLPPKSNRPISENSPNKVTLELIPTTAAFSTTYNTAVVVFLNVF
jgi:hypothetical protein